MKLELCDPMVAVGAESLCACACAEYLPVGEKQGRRVVSCFLCGLVRTLDVPDDYETLYTEGTRYHSDGRCDPSELAQTPYVDREQHDYDVAGIRWAQHFARKQLRVLDVGCANGGFLRYLREHGCLAEGVELNHYMADFAQQSSHCYVHHSVADASGPFDVVTLHDVLEHARDPQALLESLKGLMGHRALLVVDTPDTDDPRFRELGMEWHHMKPLEHLFFFNARTLTDVVQRAGFYLKEIVHPIPGKVVAYCGLRR